MVKYTDEQIHSMVILLNNLEIKGIENARRIAMITSIIDQGIKENDNGNSSKEED